MPPSILLCSFLASTHEITYLVLQYVKIYVDHYIINLEV